MESASKRRRGNAVSALVFFIGMWSRNYAPKDKGMHTLSALRLRSCRSERDEDGRNCRHYRCSREAVTERSTRNIYGSADGFHGVPFWKICNRDVVPIAGRNR